MLSFSISRKKTNQQNTLCNEVCKSLERRWVEIKDGKTFSSLFRYSDQFSPQFISKLEDRIADLVEQFQPEELVAIIKSLAANRRRNLPLLKSIAFYLMKNRDILNIKQLTDSLFAMNQLSFKDPVTIEQLCSQLERLVPGSENTAVVRSLLISLGQLKFLSPNLLDKVCDWYQARGLSSMEERDMSTLLVTLANLNYVPPRHTHLLSGISQHLETSHFLHLPAPSLVWVDVVWSLLVLGLASHSHLESVLNNEFSACLLYNNENTSLGNGTQLKLLNINGAARSMFPEYQGPLLNTAEESLLRDIKVSPSLAKVQLSQSVLEALSTIAPPPRFLSINVNTLLGCQADCELVCDSKGKPLPVSDYSNVFQSVEPKLALPPSATRVCLVVASFSECLMSGSLAGVTAFNVRLMEAQGYRVIIVTHRQLNSSMKHVARVKLLENMLASCLRLEQQDTPQ